MRGPGRREIGHGALAEKALIRAVPQEEKLIIQSDWYLKS